MPVPMRSKGGKNSVAAADSTARNTIFLTFCSEMKNFRALFEIRAFLIMSFTIFRSFVDADTVALVHRFTRLGRGVHRLHSWDSPWKRYWR